MKLSILLGAFAVATFLGAPVGAQADDGLPFSVYTGGQTDEDHGQRLDLGLSIHTLRGTTYRLDASRGDFNMGEASITTTDVDWILGQDFRAFGLSGGVRRMHSRDLAKSLAFFAGGYVKLTVPQYTPTDDFYRLQIGQVGALIEQRKIELDAPGLANVGRTGGCDLDSTGYGLNVRLDRPDSYQPRWGVYANGMIFDYSGDECSSSSQLSSTGPSTLAVNRPALFQRLGRSDSAALEGLSSSLLPRASVLLESTVMLGAELFANEAVKIGAAAYRDELELSTENSYTFLAFVEWAATSQLTVAVAVGSSDSDAADRLQFAALRLTASWPARCCGLQ